jgi:hypothetical protein
MSVKRAQGRERREADAIQRIRRSEGDPFGGPGDVTTFVGAHIWRPALWTTAFVGSTPIGAVIIGTVAHFDFRITFRHIICRKNSSLFDSAFDVAERELRWEFYKYEKARPTPPR